MGAVISVDVAEPTHPAPKPTAHGGNIASDDTDDDDDDGTDVCPVPKSMGNMNGHIGIGRLCVPSYALGRRLCLCVDVKCVVCMTFYFSLSTPRSIVSMDVRCVCCSIHTHFPGHCHAQTRSNAIKTFIANAATMKENVAFDIQGVPYRDIPEWREAWAAAYPGSEWSWTHHDEVPYYGNEPPTGCCIQSCAGCHEGDRWWFEVYIRNPFPRDPHDDDEYDLIFVGPMCANCMWMDSGGTCECDACQRRPKPGESWAERDERLKALGIPRYPS